MSQLANLIFNVCRGCVYTLYTPVSAWKNHMYNIYIYSPFTFCYCKRFLYSNATPVGIPRDIYITKGPQGYGFAMRGIKGMQSCIEYYYVVRIINAAV